jgi:hypothetical protein
MRGKQGDQAATGLPGRGADRAMQAVVIELTPILGGYRVKETETDYIDVVRMLFNWRLVRTPKDRPMTYDRGWCYQGNGPQALFVAVLAAYEWDGGDETEPIGYLKRIV